MQSGYDTALQGESWLIVIAWSYRPLAEPKLRCFTNVASGMSGASWMEACGDKLGLGWQNDRHVFQTFGACKGRCM